MPYLAVGGVLVLACAAGSVWMWTTAGERRAVLAVAHPVSVGHVLTAADLREVQVGADADLPVVDAVAADSVLGRPMGTSLPAGALLHQDAVGTVLVPAANRAMTAVAVPDGRVPPEVAAGAAVSLVAAPDESASDGAGAWAATVVGVTTRETTSTTVLSVELAPDDAREVAAVADGQISVVVLGGDR
ncbi:hypothetical protein FHR81_003240 [Actinoalloteichus hoggarensis]|uniref:SAF domain-containing protein n=1 Tax=Actinoalloteichus hoggarensis TaxID=1470176 RepID=UPI000B8B0842|nr:SAF domain-containing protein [Actinoalloteichus hoggarensis]MBB5922188.1 hypothetical protein [Actinoalloteichus hoggarensis]